MHSTTACRAKALLLVALLGSFGRAQADIGRVVRTADQLLAAVGSDRTIVLSAGTYRISRAQGDGSPSVSFEDAYDGREVVISGVQNMRLRGEDGVRILADPRYAFVLTFRDANGIKLENITLGHTEAGECAGGVLRLQSCADIEVTDCELYGSGTIGLEASECYDVRLISTEIRDCTAGAVRAAQVTEMSIDSCRVHDNGAYPLLGFEESWSVELSACTITGNSGSSLIGMDESSGEVRLSGCEVLENSAERFADEGALPELEGNRWEGNAFTDPDLGSPDEWRRIALEDIDLGFEYPGDWRAQQSAETIGIGTADQETAVILAPLYELTDDDDPADPAGVLARAFAYLEESAKGSDDTIELADRGPMEGELDGLPSQTARGAMTMSGERCYQIIRLVIVGDQVYGMLAIFRHGSEEYRADIVGTIIESLGRAPTGY